MAANVCAYCVQGVGAFENERSECQMRPVVSVHRCGTKIRSLLELLTPNALHEICTLLGAGHSTRSFLLVQRSTGQCRLSI